MPSAREYFVPVMQFSDAAILFQLFLYLFGLSIAYLLNLSQMLHVHLVYHFVGDKICVRIDHHGLHFTETIVNKW